VDGAEASWELAWEGWGVDVTDADCWDIWVAAALAAARSTTQHAHVSDHCSNPHAVQNSNFSMHIKKSQHPFHFIIFLVNDLKFNSFCYHMVCFTYLFVVLLAVEVLVLMILMISLSHYLSSKIQK